VLKVHTSNYRISGFTKAVDAAELMALTRAHAVPLVYDLGSGTLVDLARWGLAHEPTVAEAVADGAEIVTFSGDKLLGGPQAGFILGRRDLIAKINRNPIKRALRVDKIRLAALAATLRLYRDPDHLAEQLPALRLLTRPLSSIEAAAQRLAPLVRAKVGAAFAVEQIACTSEIGSGALPLAGVVSAGLSICPREPRGAGRALERLARAFRNLPIPVIGRTEGGAKIFDLRCLEDEAAFLANLETLDLGAGDGQG
jgi:L-seryl-tRNA(Ser) seleniumtransferase